MGMRRELGLGFSQAQAAGHPQMQHQQVVVDARGPAGGRPGIGWVERNQDELAVATHARHTAPGYPPPETPSHPGMAHLPTL